MKVKSESEVSQSCPTLRDPMDCSLSGSSIHGIFQARVLEWGAVAFSTVEWQCDVKTQPEFWLLETRVCAIALLVNAFETLHRNLKSLRRIIVIK